MSSLQALLAQLPQDADAKGRAFERLVKWFLENAPEYKALLKKVHHWGSSPHRWGRDTGIDLTAEAHDGTLWAIQAKAYDASYYVTKQDVDKFLSESGRRPRGRPSFDVKLLVATTDYLGANARAVLDDTPGARRLLLADLEKASISWPRSLADLRPAKAKVATPKPHQRAAIRDVIDGFGRVPRGQLIMACGTGKTLTALWAAEALEARRVLVLVPSLSLVRQTLASWYAHSTHAPPYIVICSDESVHRGEDGDELVTTTSELPYPVTTEPNAVADFLRGPGYRYVFSTYHSSPVIATAFARSRGQRPFDLVIADEAHRIAGAPDAAFATVLDAEKIKSERRLFMTATPRYATGRLVKKAKESDIEIASMDDEARFGPVLHNLTFAQAIRRDLLTDYQVAVVVVDDEVHREHAERGTFGLLDGQRVDARTVACQVGLARAMHNFNLCKVVSFHSRVKWASSFADSFPWAVGLMPRAMRPTGSLWCRHVSGSQTAKDRDTELTALKNLDATTRGLLANARCLTEGVDVPGLDGVAFIDPRRSEVDVVQAVGRAIRKARDKKAGTVVIPVFVGRRSDAVVALESSAFKPVWQVIQALRAHDDVLASQLDELRREKGRRGTTGRLPSKIKLIGAIELGSGFLAAFDTRLVEQTTATWEFWFGLLEAFVAREGSARVPDGFVTRDGLALGAWVTTQRISFRKGTLCADKSRQLAALSDWSWDPREDAWETGFLHLEAFVRTTGHANPSQSCVANGYRLGAWVVNQRTRPPSLDKRKRLEALDGWTWNTRTRAWDQGFAHLREFVANEGHARVLFSYVARDGFTLGRWVTKQRAKGKDKLSGERASLLEQLPGWTWDAQDSLWDEGYAHLAEFVTREGHARVPRPFTTEEGFKLGAWVGLQRANRERLPSERQDRLMSMHGWTWDPFADDWENGFRELEAFVRKYDHARVPNEHVTMNGFALGKWVVQQRSRRRRNVATKEQTARLSSLNGWVWNTRTTAWENGFVHLVAFAETQAHARVPKGFVCTDGFRLGDWVNMVRTQAKRGELVADRAARISRLPGWTWSPGTDAWDAGFQHLQDFIKNVGHARVPFSYVCDDGFDLGKWVNRQRTAGKSRLPVERVGILNSVRGWTWDPFADDWETAFQQLAEFVSRERHARVPASFVTATGFKLGKWVVRQRRNESRTTDRGKRLEQLTGWGWDPFASAWEEAYCHLREFTLSEGHAKVPTSHVTPDGFRLGGWVSKQRSKRSSLSQDQRKRLQSLPGWAW